VLNARLAGPCEARSAANHAVPTSTMRAAFRRYQRRSSTSRSSGDGGSSSRSRRRPVADLESSATEIRCYESGIVPGLLQSPEYLRAVMMASDGVWWEPSIAELHERITFRAERQARIFDSDEPRELRFVLTEDALRGAVGGLDVMREQRRHILNLLESKQNLTVRVLRRETLGNPASAGGLTVFGFGDRGVPVGFSSVVYGPSTYFDDESDTAALLRAFERLEELAASAEESARLIRQIDEER
jgi:hypothetical protein